MRPHVGDNLTCPGQPEPAGRPPQELGIPDTQLEFYEIAAATINDLRGEGHIIVDFTVEEADGSPVPDGYLRIIIDGLWRRNGDGIIEFWREVGKEQAGRIIEDTKDDVGQ